MTTGKPRVQQASSFSREQGSSSMADDRLASRRLGAGRVQAGNNGACKNRKLVFGNGPQKRFQEHDAFAKAGVQVEVVRANPVPQPRWLNSSGGDQSCHAAAEIAFKVFDKFLQIANLVKKVRALGQQDATKQVAHSRATPASTALKIGRIERGNTGHSSVVAGVRTEGS
jgi:hypothetical protein